MELILHILSACRPRQWVKNFGLYIPIVVTGKLLDPTALTNTTLGFIAFCLLSSSNYLMNDMIDASSDKQHPLKKYRPLARSAITYTEAFIATILLAGGGFLLAQSIRPSFLYVSIGFVVVHYLLYFFFRKMPVFDLLTIGAGYLLRVVAGEQASGSTMSVWLFLSILSASLLLAIGKRRNELAFIEKSKETLLKEEFPYSEKILDSYIAVFASSTFLAYAYFAFLTNVTTPGLLFNGYTIFLFNVIGRKWFMVSVPFILYGIMRYLQLVYVGKESLSKMILSDRSLLGTLGFWLLSILVVVYGIGG